jgi:hypothetical protein
MAGLTNRSRARIASANRSRTISAETLVAQLAVATLIEDAALARAIFARIRKSTAGSDAKSGRASLSLLALAGHRYEEPIATFRPSSCLTSASPSRCPFPPDSTGFSVRRTCGSSPRERIAECERHILSINTVSLARIIHE